MNRACWRLAAALVFLLLGQNLLSILGSGPTATAVAADQAAGPPAKTSPTASSMAEPLAALVPGDVGLSIEIHEPATHVRRFLQGGFRQRLADFPPFKKWIAESGPQWSKISGEFQRRLGITAEELLSDLLGREVLFAVWPPSAPGGSDGPALLLFRTSDERLLSTVLERLVAVLRETGKWKETRLVERAGQVDPLHVIEIDGPSNLYVTTLGNLGLLTTSEELVQHVLDLGTEPGAERSLAALPPYLAGMDRLASDAAVKVFINPRPWDQLLLAEVRSKPDGSSEAQAQLAVVQTWQATEYAVMSLEIGPRLAAEAFMKWNHRALPEVVREVADSLAGASPLVDHVPADALVAVAGKLDIGRLLRRFARPEASDHTDGTTQDERAAAGWRAVRALAAGLGPDFCAYLAPAATPGGDERNLAIDLVAIFDTQPIGGQQTAPLAQLLDPLLQSLLPLVAAAANAESGQALVEAKVVQEEGLTLTSIVGLGGPLASRIEATYTAVESRFWIGTSPLAVRRAARLQPQDMLSGTDSFQRLLGPRLTRPSQVFYINLAGLRQLIELAPGLIDYLATAKGLDRQTAKRSGRELAVLLKLADSLLAAAQVDESGVSLALSVGIEGR